MARLKTEKRIEEEREQVLEALLNQLDTLGLTHAHYRKMAEDYAVMYAIKERLIKDIQKRGVVTKYEHGGGQEGWKRNDSLQELPKIVKSMEGILMSLGVRATQLKMEDSGMEI